jgi:hypothetical protein
MFEISGSYVPLIILYTSIMSPLDLLYDNDGSFRRRKRSSYDKSESPGINFVAKLSFDYRKSTKPIIRRTFDYLDLKTFRILSVSLVILHLEYANPVWNPYLKKHTDIIENIQRKTFRLVIRRLFNFSLCLVYILVWIICIYVLWCYGFLVLDVGKCLKFQDHIYPSLSCIPLSWRGFVSIFVSINGYLILKLYFINIWHI